MIVGGWVILLLLAYKVSQFDYEYANFDPYEILGVPMVRFFIILLIFLRILFVIFMKLKFLELIENVCVSE